PNPCRSGLWPRLGKVAAKGRSYSSTPRNSMQYIYTSICVSKVVRRKREIIKDISLSFFPGAKIGLLGLNGAGKSTVLRIMAGVDTVFHRETRSACGIHIGHR